MTIYAEEQLYEMSRLMLRRVCKESGLPSEDCANMDFDTMVKWFLKQQDPQPKSDAPPQEWLAYFFKRTVRQVMKEHDLDEETTISYLEIKEQLRRVSPSVALRPAEGEPGQFFAWIKTPNTANLSGLEVLLDFMTEKTPGLLKPPPIVHNNVRLEQNRAEVFKVVAAMKGEAGQFEIFEALNDEYGMDVGKREISTVLGYLVKVGVISKVKAGARNLYAVIPDPAKGEEDAD
jgi:hypothetical protein